MKKLFDIYNEYYGVNIVIAIFTILFVIGVNTYTLPIIFLAVMVIMLDILNALYEYLVRLNKSIASESIDMFKDILKHDEKVTKINNELLKFNKQLIAKMTTEQYELNTIEWAIKECYVDINRKVMKRNIDSWKNKYIFLDDGDLIVHEQNSDNVLFSNTKTFREDNLSKDWIVVDSFTEDLVSKDWNDVDNT